MPKHLIIYKQIKEYLSRTEAAKVLGCDPQSISNYASRGLFESMKGDKCVYVEKTSFEKFINEYFETVKANDDIKAALAKELADFRDEIEKQRKDVEDKALFTRAIKDYYTFVCSGSMRTACLELVDVFKSDNVKRASIWNDLLNGCSRTEMQETYGITRERLRQQAVRGLIDMKRTASEVKGLRKDNEELSARCARQHTEIKGLQKEINLLNNTIDTLCKKLDIKKKAYGDGMGYLLKKELKRIYIYDLDLSVRALNALKYAAECNTLYDIVTLKKSEVKHLRNIGRKTIIEVEEMLYEYGIENFCKPLTFDMDL